MKKTITYLALLITSGLTVSAQVQTSVADFENFNTGSNITYTSTTSTPFQTTNAIFPYEWNSGFSYWAGGFSYTNKYDSSTASFSNLHGVKAYKGYNNSAMYTVGQDRGTIKLKAPFNSADGFYITNTTYTFKTIRNGNQFARKFGDTTGTGSGTTIAQGSYPDWFKVTVKGFFNGSMKNDSVEYYLADYRFSNNALDYVIGSWQWINTAPLGQVDSIQFFMYSSDVGQWGINTPLFFAIDNFTTSNPFVGLTENSRSIQASLYPNPFSTNLKIHVAHSAELIIADISGKKLLGTSLQTGENNIDLNTLDRGIYFARIESNDAVLIKKIIKE